MQGPGRGERWQTSESGLQIVYWCQFFWPEVSAPSRRLLDFGRVWVEEGNRVTIVTGMPNHPTGVIPPAYRRRLLAREEKDGLRVLRSWVFASPNQAGAKKLLGHISFALTSAINGVRLGPTDVVIASSPTFFATYTAWIVARARRAAFILEVRDLWPEAFIGLGVLQRGLTTRILEALVGFIYHRSDHIVVVTDSFAQRIATKGVPAAKITTITNGADVDWFGSNVSASADALRRELGLENKFVVAYVGAHGVSHGLASVMKAASQCRDKRIVFLFVGDGSEKPALEAYRDDNQLANVVMLPSQPSESIREFYSLADICLVPLRDIPLFEAFIPSKMFEMMAAGRPIIASVRGEAQEILERSNAALVIPPENPDALLEAIEVLVEAPERRARMAAAGRAFVAANYSRRALGQRYATLLSESVL
jgi:glycosyltransferase involved in cell wall biosynthesis